MKNTRWKFYNQTDDAWSALKEAFLNARKSICIEQFIFERDEVGQEFFECLIERARAGVKVRVLCDMVGSYGFWASSLPDTLRDAGVEVRFFNVIKPWRVHNFLSWFFRDHRKLILVDSTSGFVGGVNFRADMRNWRDTQIKVWGEITKEMQFSFEQMWNTAGEKKFLKRLRVTKRFIKGFQFLTNSPFPRKRFLYQEVVHALREAKDYVHITTPYFLPDRRLRRIFRICAHRGVDVKIILPEISDVPIVDIASGTYIEKLLRSGVKIYRYQGNTLHAKTIVVDGGWATVGSFNLNPRSLVYDYEANVVSTNEDFSREVEYYFRNDLQISKELLLQTWKNRPVLRKLKEILTLPIRRFL